jgi:hypothetical protein
MDGREKRSGFTVAGRGFMCWLAVGKLLFILYSSVPVCRCTFRTVLYVGIWYGVGGVRKRNMTLLTAVQALA